MTPREFLDLIVRPNMDEFRNDYADLRKAFNVSFSVDALAAHIYDASGRAAGTGAKDDSAFRAELAANSPDFALVRDIAKALKHVELDRHSPAVKRADQVEKRALGWGEARWGEGRWGSPPQVVVTTNSGDKRVVETVLGNALSFLESEMAKRNL